MYIYIYIFVSISVYVPFMLMWKSSQDVYFYVMSFHCLNSSLLCILQILSLSVYIYLEEKNGKPN